VIERVLRGVDVGINVARRGVARHERDIPKPVDRGLDQHVGEGEKRSLESRGKPDDDDLFELFGINTKFTQFNFTGSVHAHHVDQNEDACNPVRSGGCNADTERAQPKHKHHYKVEPHVCNTRGRKKDQRTGGVTRRAQDRRAVVIQNIGRHAAKISHHVGYRLIEYGGVGFHHGKQRACHAKSEHREESSEKQRDDHRCVHRSFYVTVLFCTNVMRYANARANRKTKEKVDDEVDQRTARAHRRQRRFAFGWCVAAPLTNHNGVRRVEQLLQKCRCDQRKREKDHFGKKWSVRQISFNFRCCHVGSFRCVKT